MDKEKSLYERAIITSIIVLIISVLFKLFGVRWFDLDTDIVWLKYLNTLVMNSTILSFIYSFIFKFINGYLICGIAMRNHKIENVYLIASVSILSILLNYLLKNNPIILLFDFVGLYTICSQDSNLKEYSLTIVLNILYQIISLFIRNLSIHISYYGLVTSILLNLDYYILLVITYLYLKKRGITLCLIVHHSFSFLRKKLLKKHLKNYSNKGGSNHEQK